MIRSIIYTKLNNYVGFYPIGSFCNECWLPTDSPLKNPQISKSNLPQKYLIEEVPICKQGHEECGPTSLQMVMNFYGKNLAKEEISQWILRTIRRSF